MAIEIPFEWSVITCCNCQMSFSVPANVEQHLRRTHKSFYCPAGHVQHFPEKTVEQLRIAELQRVAESRQREIDRLAATVDCKRAMVKKKEYQARYWKGKVTKIKKEII